VLYAVIFFAIFGSFVYFIMREIHLKGKLKKEKELSESKFTFFTNISHEFRTPLTLITGPLKELISRKDLHEDVSEKLVLVEKNADRLLNLITQLLDFRKAEHGLLQLDAKNGNIVRFCNEVFLYFQEQAGSKNIEYVFMSKVDEIFMPFDRNKMEIALCNLLSNAIKYTPEGESITVELDQVDKDCVIRIKDTGLGMDKKLKNKIFDRFYQIRTTNTSNMVGTGIGLSFTKKIVELHKGSIEVDSKLEQGTEFTIQIPVNLLKIEEAVSFNSNTIDQYKKLDEADVVDLNVENKENTILVIDDNSDIRNYLKDLLKSEYNILQAKDGVEGIEIATKETPDLILCDIMMPRKDGLTVSKELKSQIKTSHIPIILLTARSSNLFEIEGLKTGADDFVTKPFDPHVIKARITSVLQNRLKTREHFVNKIRFEPIQSTEASSDPESEFINEAVLLVENNLSNEQFDIKVMVDTLNMSQSTLYRKIKSLTGLSLTGFIRSVRLKKAAEIILTTNEKMSTVAIIVGFNDNKYFRESFKKQYGCLPSEYKELKKKKQDV
jgi:DNA-binding response OmpR family regulator/nitrogen-specific signal transduction histidine kinase